MQRIVIIDGVSFLGGVRDPTEILTFMFLRNTVILSAYLSAS